MSRDIILTGWTGTEFAMIASHTFPLIARYAESHDIFYASVHLAGSRPPSWQKIPAILAAIDSYDRVLWLDADVVVNPASPNIFDELSEGAIQGLVPHETPSGVVPNCGVWLLAKGMAPTLVEAWNCSRHIEHPWWEQAVMLELMGYEISSNEHGFPLCLPGKPNSLRERTEWLLPRWNHHPFDARRATAPNFIHVTGYQDRVGVVKELCSVY